MAGIVAMASSLGGMALAPVVALAAGLLGLAVGIVLGHFLPERKRSAPGAGLQAEMSRETRHLHSIVASMSDGVLVTNARGEVELTNPAWQRLFGDDLGAGDLEVRARIDRLIRYIAESGEETQEEVRLPGARSKTVLITGTSMETGLGVVLQARDLTAYLRLSEMRRDFVGNVSHELRTPLAAIRGYAETLIDGALDDAEAAPRFTQRIVDQCGRLEVLLSDLLALSSLEHPSAGDKLEWLRFDDLVRSAADTIVGRAEEKGIRLDLKIDPVPPIRGDADALERMCLNLLQNAVAYNRPQGRVSARLFQRGEEELVLEIEDTGIGIPEKDLDRVFERFYRVDKGRSRGEGGTGLGLAIAKHAAQLHGGRIVVESVLGEGTLFRVVLPRKS